MNEREVETMRALEAPRGRELLLGIVDSNHVSTTTLKPRRDVGGTAAKLDDVFAGEIIRKHSDLGLGHAPDAPTRHIVRPRAFADSDVRGRQSIPMLAVATARVQVSRS